ncbi:MAG: hypothetical protein GTN73_07660 [Candidatus Aminicenantes bacterium]|nr:hypothetical protein [Candidatus Aminicenantes bacterium]
MKKPRPKKSPFLRESPLVEEEEIFSTLEEKRGTSLFLGRYTLNEVIAVLTKKSFFKEAQKRKLWPLEFDLDSSEFPLQRFQIFYRETKPENMIVDLKIKEGAFYPKKKIASYFPLSEYKFLSLDWLTLQNPLLDFSLEKSPLPGQKHPGLNLGKKVFDIFVYLARLSKKDGVLAFPNYFHNALLFSRFFYFLNPEKMGEVLAIRASFPDVSFKKLAWIVYLECMRDKKGKKYEWKAEEQVFPLNKALINYFDSKKYKEKVKESKEQLSFEIDWECYKKKISEKGWKYKDLSV